MERLPIIQSEFVPCPNSGRGSNSETERFLIAFRTFEISFRVLMEANRRDRSLAFKSNADSKL